MDWIVAILFFSRCASSSTVSLRNFSSSSRFHEASVVLCRPYDKQASKKMCYAHSRLVRNVRNRKVKCGVINAHHVIRPLKAAAYTRSAHSPEEGRKKHCGVEAS